jgi:16S rRNA (guanine1516-N2)-methyltransferase
VTVQIHSLAVTDAELNDKSVLIAERCGLQAAALDSNIAQLVLTLSRLEIRVPGLGGPVFIDFTTGKYQHRRQFGGGRGQPLAKAVGLKKGATPYIIDATAGFGRDAFVFASLGCRVTLIEQNPLIAALLADALQRAEDDHAVIEIISRMQLHQGNAVDYLAGLLETDRPDVVYLDPMYPSRDKSALVKKEMQLLHQLVGPDSNNSELLNVSREVALKRVAVKRPKGAEFFAHQQPHVSIESKNTRYDIYTCG